MDTLGLTIVTDLIKQVTLGDYTSYTMEIVNQKDTIIFYNLTLDYKNGESSMFVTKYIPDEYWLNNKEEYYSGGIFSKRVNKLKVHTELDDLFADNSGSVINGNDLGLGGGAGGGSFNFQGTPTYPADCNGIVIVSIQAIPYPCGCENHMPWECNGCSESPAGYNYIPYYFCQDYGNGGGGNPPDSGGGPSNPLNPNDNSIGAMIMPVECTKKIVGDLNGDCMLSPYEACLLSVNSQEVCDCVEEGGNLDTCLDEVIVDETLKNNPCLFDVYTQLGKVSGFQYYLQNFDGDFSIANLRLSAGNVGSHAITSPPENSLIEIEFDITILSTVPPLDVAGTFIHELIHAEIFRKMMIAAKNGSLDPVNMTSAQQINYVNNLKNNFPGIYDYYINRYHPNWTHQMMAQHYLNIIIEVLEQYDSTQSDEFYESIAWIGLMGQGIINSATGLPLNPTIAWQNIPQTQRLQILNTYNNFKNNNSPCQ